MARCLQSTEVPYYIIVFLEYFQQWLSSRIVLSLEQLCIAVASKNRNHASLFGVISRPLNVVSETKAAHLIPYG